MARLDAELDPETQGMLRWREQNRLAYEWIKARGLLLVFEAQGWGKDTALSWLMNRLPDEFEAFVKQRGIA